MTTLKNNKATEPISISLPGWLLDILDRICEEKDFTRSSFSKRAIKKYILMNIDSPALWEKIYHETME